MTTTLVLLVVVGLLGVAVVLYIAMLLGFMIGSAIGDDDLPLLGATVIGLLGIVGALAVLFALVGFLHWSWTTWSTLLA